MRPFLVQCIFLFHIYIFLAPWRRFRTVQLNGKRWACSWLGLSLRVNPHESPGIGLEVFEISAVGISRFFIIFRQDCGCISGEMTGHFLTVQEEPFKILMSNKQTVSFPAQGEEAASHPAARKQAPLNLTVVCFQTLSSLPDLENDTEPVLVG